ncbi:MAG: hypothetical protein V4614_14600 [Pseudomonadota bacterium]
MSTLPQPTPQERLAVSRKAIVRYMTQDESFEEAEAQRDDGMEGYGEPAGKGGTWSVVKHAVKVWWQHHPAQLAVNLARPSLDKYAQDKPLQLLGIAAGIGAAAVVIKPWKLISVTGLLFTALKASDLPVLLMSVLSSRRDDNTDKGTS